MKCVGLTLFYAGNADSFAIAILQKAYDDNAPVHAVKSIYWAGTEYTYHYDANGNMTAGSDFTDPTQVAGRTIKYNADNMPVEIDRTYGGNTATISLTYDGDGKRVKKAVAGGGTTYYIGNHFEVEAGTETKYIFGGNLRIAKVTASTSHFYHKDHLGSSTAVTSYPDSTQIQTAEYLPFGLTRTRTGTEVTYYKFTDQELDPSTGLYNYDARLYDPATGRFVSPDSIAPDWYDPQSLDRYAYARNNPLKYIDPDGHIFWDVVDIVSFVHSAVNFARNPSWANAGWLALDTVGLAPGVPGGGTVKAGIKGANKVAEIVSRTKKAGTKVDAASKATSKGSKKKTHQTYKKPNPHTKKVYNGRTSGTGTPLENIAKRDVNHHMNKKGFGPAKLDNSSTNKSAIRGREQQNIEAGGGTKSQGGTSGNAINGISEKNPQRDHYIDETNREFGK